MATELHSAGYEVERYWTFQYQADLYDSRLRIHGGRIYRNLPSRQSLREANTVQADL
jgi:hypothetical protein